MENKYDVIIIGAGPSGIFCAYELIEKKPDIRVLIVEKGRSICLLYTSTYEADGK